MTTAAIVILGQGSLGTARRIQAALEPGTPIHGLTGRVEGADVGYESFGETLRGLHRDDVAVIALCASGIVIRALAPLLQNKRSEPPVLAVAEDGSAVVPLLGGLRGVNGLAQRVGAALGTAPAITTTGEVRFGLTLEAPPAGYVARDPGASKAFMSDLLGGATARLEGHAPWIADSRLPLTEDGGRVIRVTPEDRDAAPGDLVFHPATVVVAVEAGDPALPARVAEALAKGGLAHQAVAMLLARARDAAHPEVHQAAAALGCPLRFVDAPSAEAMADLAIPEDARARPLATHGPVALAVATTPETVRPIGRPRGRLAVVGLGPGTSGLCAPVVREELRRATHWIGYETYLRMAGRPRPDQVVLGSDNRVEMDRARHAFALAAEGARVAVVSSGDPGVFAMATAVMEALHENDDPAWHGVDLAILPGISAAQGAAALVGAPLGHDFCVISLSDNLKPLDVILDRVEHAARADLAMALYNPVSRARPWQLTRVLERLLTVRAAGTPVVLARDVGRPAQAVTVTTLGAVRPEQVDMRTVVLVGSSATRTFGRVADGGTWVYSPRWYVKGEG
ncbi:precorrin-3B C(17)-methyltransferase [Roseospira visakhapatnamensis]|uniref:Cobalt-precorrin 5A hydrolase/precorrin-3B C17-methyltransferase n=1 Tax=Roseospira visakhapatnamensis TaxID=390880 RepID=A0A7W6RFM1_9PROT|nr:precorrin-3B C(17)-methyltransferase [Roseospira visakhapatnamensis]MBB4267134.1 cobalt-precorrin 5A hydrolase/precorrin-3B C17-methyltransferase [Roseospira visakhapatnamensis]